MNLESLLTRLPFLKELLARTQPGKIFINYRRDDSAPHALSIAQYLERQFGSSNVFIDVDRIRAGENFVTVLDDRLGLSKIMLAVIGPNWINAKDSTGKRRLENPEDWVRVEIATALKKGVRVVPILVAGASLPAVSELPRDLKPLVKMQAATVTTNNFRHDMAGLAGDIAELVGRPRIGSVNTALIAAFAAIVALMIYLAIPRGENRLQQPGASFEAGLSARCKADLQTWRTASATAAFAVTSNGNCGFSSEIPKLNAARVAALAECAKNGSQCRIVETIDGDWTMNAKCVSDLAAWRQSGLPAKAFAISRSGHCAATVDKINIETARTQAIDECDKFASECRIRESDAGNWEMRPECKNDLAEWSKKSAIRIFVMARNGMCASSWQYENAEEAKKAAMNDCEQVGSECKIIESFEGNWAVTDECQPDLIKWRGMRGRGAFAVGQRGDCGYSHSYSSQSEAHSRALKECTESGGENCRVVYQK